MTSFDEDPFLGCTDDCSGITVTIPFNPELKITCDGTFSIYHAASGCEAKNTSLNEVIKSELAELQGEDNFDSEYGDDKVPYDWAQEVIATLKSFIKDAQKHNKKYTT